MKSATPSDGEIVKKVLLGDTEAFGVLFDRYAKKVFGYLCNFTRRREDCEDFLQDTFYKAYVNLRYCRERERFSSWLFAIAHNVAVSNSRKLSSYYSRELSEDIFHNLADTSPLNELNARLVRQEGISNLRKAIAEMPPKYREAVVLFYYNEFSLKEISTIVDIPVNTVKTRLHRGRQYLSAELREPPEKYDGGVQEISLAKTPTQFQ